MIPKFLRDFFGKPASSPAPASAPAPQTDNLPAFPKTEISPRQLFEAIAGTVADSYPDTDLKRTPTLAYSATGTFSRESDGLDVVGRVCAAWPEGGEGPFRMSYGIQCAHIYNSDTETWEPAIMDVLQVNGRLQGGRVYGEAKLLVHPYGATEDKPVDTSILDGFTAQRKKLGFAKPL